MKKSYNTPCGDIYYWIEPGEGTPLVFLPGLTADHRLFEKQVEAFKDKYPLLVWDAPGHGVSWPFDLDFSLEDVARWLIRILEEEGFDSPVIIGQSMGGYVAQMYSELYPDKLKGFISIDSAPLQRAYFTQLELWGLKQMEPVYRNMPWETLLESGIRNVSTSDYGRELMRKMILDYDQERYAKLAGHGFRILAEAIERDLPYEIKAPALLICGDKDRAGSCKRYSRNWHKKSGFPLIWIRGAGHNANTDKPDEVNFWIETFMRNMKLDEKELEDIFKSDTEEFNSNEPMGIDESALDGPNKKELEEDLKILEDK